MAKEYNKNYWLKEIAFSFGMNIGQFADAIGYRRQTLYCAGHGECRLNRGHIRVAVDKLNNLSEKIMYADIEAAKDRHYYRRRLIDDFAKRFNAEDE